MLKTIKLNLNLQYNKFLEIVNNNITKNENLKNVLENRFSIINSELNNLNKKEVDKKHYYKTKLRFDLEN